MAIETQSNPSLSAPPSISDGIGGFFKSVFTRAADSVIAVQEARANAKIQSLYN